MVNKKLDYNTACVVCSDFKLIIHKYFNTCILIHIHSYKYLNFMKILVSIYNAQC